MARRCSTPWAAGAAASYLASHLSPRLMVGGHPAPALAELAQVHSYTIAFWWAAGMFAAGAVLAALLFRGRHPHGADRTGGFETMSPHSAGQGPRCRRDRRLQAAPVAVGRGKWPAAGPSGARGEPAPLIT